MIPCRKGVNDRGYPSVKEYFHQVVYVMSGNGHLMCLFGSHLSHHNPFPILLLSFWGRRFQMMVDFRQQYTANLLSMLIVESRFHVQADNNLADPIKHPLF